jgi:hypothetical protein
MLLMQSVPNKPFIMDVIKLNVIMLNVVKLNVVMLNVVMLNVVAPPYVSTINSLV